MTSDERNDFLLVRAGRLLDPARDIDRPGCLLLRGGRFEAVLGDGAPLPSGAAEVDARRFVVAPGFVDIHVHFRDPGPGTAEDVGSGGRAAAAGGFTTVCCMANTSPVNDSPEITRELVRKSARTSPVEVRPIAAVTHGLRGETLTDFRALREAGAVALSDDGRPVLNAEIMAEALRRSRDEGLVVIDHAEDTCLSCGGAIHEGEVARSLGVGGISGESETAMVRRDAGLAAETKGSLHVAHVSVAGAFEAIRAAKRSGARVTAEVTPHHLTLDVSSLASGDPNFKMNPPLRTTADVEAAIESLRDGTVDAIATDHAPHPAEEKAKGLARAPFGIVGLETAFALLHTELVGGRGAIDLPRLVRLLTAGPASVLGLERGAFLPGRPADFVLLDTDAAWTVDPSRFRSKSRNTPWSGARLRGAIAGTWRSGRRVHPD